MNIQCFVPEGDLPLKIKWILNGKELEIDDGVSIANIGKRSSVLTIEPVGANNAGKYTCFAQNSAGATEYSSELKVIGYFTNVYIYLSVIVYLFFLVFLPNPNHLHE